MRYGSQSFVMREAHIEQCLVYLTERFCGQRPQHERMSKSGLPDWRGELGGKGVSNRALPVVCDN